MSWRYQRSGATENQDDAKQRAPSIAKDDGDLEEGEEIEDEDDTTQQVKKESSSPQRQRSHRPSSSGPQKSVEGWVIIVTNLHEECDQDGLVEKFSDYGPVTKIHVNMDRKTGLAKGYALMEFKTHEEAQDSINALHGKMFLGQRIGVDWAFVKPVGAARRARRGSR